MLRCCRLRASASYTGTVSTVSSARPIMISSLLRAPRYSPVCLKFFSSPEIASTESSWKIYRTPSGAWRLSSSAIFSPSLTPRAKRTALRLGLLGSVAALATPLNTPSRTSNTTPRTPRLILGEYKFLFALWYGPRSEIALRGTIATLNIPLSVLNASYIDTRTLSEFSSSVVTLDLGIALFLVTSKTIAPSSRLRRVAATSPLLVLGNPRSPSLIAICLAPALRSLCKSILLPIR